MKFAYENPGYEKELHDWHIVDGELPEAFQNKLREFFTVHGVQLIVPDDINLEIVGHLIEERRTYVPYVRTDRYDPPFGSGSYRTERVKGAAEVLRVQRIELCGYGQFAVRAYNGGSYLLTWYHVTEGTRDFLKGKRSA